MLALVPPWTCAPQLKPKHKLRVANAVNNLRYVPDPTLGIVYLDSWLSNELRVAIMRNALESRVERTKREKEQK